MSTLRFATRAKTVKNKAKVNELGDNSQSIAVYIEEIKRLREELNKRERQEENERAKIQEEEYINIVEKNEVIEQELNNLKDLYIQEKKRNNKFEKEVEDLKSDIKKSFMETNNNKTSSNFRGFQNPNDNISLRDSYNPLNTLSNNKEDPDVSFIDDMKKQIEYLTGINSSKNYSNWNQDINTLSNEFK